MNTTSAILRRNVLAGSVGLLGYPPIAGPTAAATRGMTDTELIIGTMDDLSGVTAVQGVNNAHLGEAGYTAATFIISVLEKAGRDLTVEALSRQWRVCRTGATSSAARRCR